MIFWKRNKLFMFDNRRPLIRRFVVVAFLISSFFLISSAYANYNYSNWNEGEVGSATKAYEIYNDGIFSVTSSIDGFVDPHSGKVSSNDTIKITNLDSTDYISFNSVKIVPNYGYEDVDFQDWKISNNNSVLFDGNMSTSYIPDIKLKHNQSMSFNVATNLEGTDVGRLINTCPFNFVYDYQLNPYDVNYYVSIFGITEDEVLDDSHLAGLTFGPAMGDSPDSLYVDGHEHHSPGKHCICTDSWEEIVEHCNNKEWELYSDCLEYRCAKKIPIKLNDKLWKKLDYDSDCSSMGACIKADYRFLNYNQSDTDSESTIYANSRIRATLNGYDEDGSNFTPSKYAPKSEEENDCLIRSNCLLSCFPEVLQNNILPKYMLVPTSYNLRSPWTITGKTYILDKLWLPSADELYARTVDESFVDMLEFGKIQLSRKMEEGTTFTSYSNNRVFEAGMSSACMTRTSFKTTNRNSVVLSDGQINQNTAGGLAPLFNLGYCEKHLDFYNLEQLNYVSRSISYHKENSYYYNDIQNYMNNDEIWWSNSEGYFNKKGYNPSSIISDEDVQYCNQKYKCSFKNSDGSDVPDSNQFIFLRILDINHDNDDAIVQMRIFKGLSLQCIHSLPNAYYYGTSNEVNWSTSDLRTYLNNVVYEQIPESIKNNLFLSQQSYASQRTWARRYIKDINENIFIPSYSNMWALDRPDAYTNFEWTNNYLKEDGTPIAKPANGCEGFCYWWNWLNKISAIEENPAIKDLWKTNNGTKPNNETVEGAWLRSFDPLDNDKWLYINNKGQICDSVNYDEYLGIAPYFVI